MVRLFFRREKKAPVVKAEETSDELSSSSYSEEPRFNNHESSLDLHDELDTSEERKPMDFAAAGRVKWAVRTVLDDVERWEVEDDSESCSTFSEMKQKIFESMVSSKHQDEDLSLGGDSKKDEDDVSAIACNWMLSPQQVFDLTVSTLRAQIETMEERNNFISRIRSLEKQLDDKRETDHLAVTSNMVLDEKSREVVQLLQQVETLKQELQESRETIDKLQQERDTHKNTVTELSRVLRSTDLDADDACRLSNAKVKPRQADVITPERALYLTIYSLKKKIESLEDETHDFKTEIHNLGATLNELKEEKEARELKISVLESQFEVMDKQFKVMDDAMKEGPLTCHLA